MDTEWWKAGVIYQVYPRSFQDSNGDGVGDLGGIVQRLSHFTELGVDAICRYIPHALSSRRVTITETRMEPTIPSPFEKKKNIRHLGWTTRDVSARSTWTFVRAGECPDSEAIWTAQSHQPDRRITDVVLMLVDCTPWEGLVAISRTVAARGIRRSRRQGHDHGV
ncbi:MAG: hypothetical protein ACJ8EJ_02790 [Xanthobacteraceae bacterium]